MKTAKIGEDKYFILHLIGPWKILIMGPIEEKLYFGSNIS